MESTTSGTESSCKHVHLKLWYLGVKKFFWFLNGQDFSIFMCVKNSLELSFDKAICYVGTKDEIFGMERVDACKNYLYDHKGNMCKNIAEWTQ